MDEIFAWPVMKPQAAAPAGRPAGQHLHHRPHAAGQQAQQVGVRPGGNCQHHRLWQSFKKCLSLPQTQIKGSKMFRKMRQDYENHVCHNLFCQDKLTFTFLSSKKVFATLVCAGEFFFLWVMALFSTLPSSPSSGFHKIFFVR